MGMEQEFFDFILIVEDLKAVQVKKLVLSPFFLTPSLPTPKYCPVPRES